MIYCPRKSYSGCYGFFCLYLLRTIKKYIMIGIYKITSPSGKIYIGQSVNIKRRWTYYKSMSKKSKQTALLRSLNKYGYIKHHFDIVEECEAHMLNERERFWQDHYNVISCNGLNCVLTGVEHAPCIISEDTKLKMSISRKGKIPWNKGKSFDAIKGEKHWRFGKGMLPHVKEALREANYGKPSHKKGVPLSLSVKEKMMNTKKIRNLPSSFKGRKHSESSKELMRKSCMGKTGVLNGNSKIIFNPYNGVFFYGCTEASFSINVKSSTLQSWLSGARPNSSPMYYV